MNHPALNDRVRLTRSLPDLWLQCGSVGIIRSIWFSSPWFYEVEFQKAGEAFGLRALIQADQLEVMEAAQKKKANGTKGVRQ